MSKVLSYLLFFSFVCFASCEKEKPAPFTPDVQAGTVSGIVTDSKGAPLPGIKIVIEHTVWAGTYVFATTDANGKYKVKIPAEPAGSWTAKAQVKRTVEGQEYIFDLAVDKSDAFDHKAATVRNFTWKLSGPKLDGNGFYGAHVDVYQWGTDVPLTNVKLVFTPFDENATLIDGSTVPLLERMVEDIAGTYMVKDIPIGKYTVKAVYPGKTLLLKNRHKDEMPASNKAVVFGKHGYLAETEYNIEFWLSD